MPGDDATLFFPSLTRAVQTAECALKFSRANNCKETLSLPLSRKTYDEWLKNPGYDTPIGPPKTSAVVILLLLCAGISALQFRSLKATAVSLHDREAASLVARKKATPEVMSELRRAYLLDSPFALLRELWLVKVFLVLPGVVRSSAEVATASTSSMVAGPRAQRDPGSAAVYALLHQGLKLALVLGALWVAWAAATGATGSPSPLFVVREDSGGFERGDLLVLQWGRAVFEHLRAGDVLVYHQMEADAHVTLSRVTAVHMEGSDGKRVVGGDVWIMTKKDHLPRDDRSLRLRDSSENYFFGKDANEPGRVFFKIPYVGLPVLAFGDASVLLYILGFGYVMYSLIQAGRAAKRARLAARPAIVKAAKLNKSQ